jgi:hypothetical protein
MAFPQFSRSITVKRPPAGDYVRGVWSEGADTELTFETPVQPASDKERKALPDGYDVDSVVELSVDTTTLPQIAQRGLNKNSDKLEIEGQEYDIIKLERWTNGVIPHYWIVAALKNNE